MKDSNKDKNNATDDVVFDDESTDSNPKEVISKLRDKLKTCISEKQEYLDGWQRSKADFINYKKNEAQNKLEFIKYAKEDLLSDLLPVLDAFDMAFQNKEVWEKVDKNWRVGIEYIHNHFISTLEKNNLKQINPIGEVFNPQKHQSIETVKVDDIKKDGLIIEVLQRGYELNGKIIRPPNVKVGEFKK
ncbi:nucleotide exchange factor GrpE [Candidatus Nomurabacteria bacterium]|nr:nucleotide exchange factor GrpE [Candidatus Nomurabacteria bacterium]